MYAFGPVPSRRFGQSLGINTIPAKRCSYACTYCQVHVPTTMQVLRADFAAVGDVVRDVARRVAECRDAGQRIDHLSFVPDGEPTLDAGLGAMIRALRPLRIPVAVVTNGTLLWRSDVRRDLLEADVVSVKVDAVTERAWRRLNRPSPQLARDRVLRGLLDFARAFRGTLHSETLLVAGMNDGEAEVRATAAFLARLRPQRAYLSPPTRPPFETNVRPPSGEALVRAYAIVREHVADVELLGAETRAAFGAAGDAAEDLLAILAIHPMEESAVRVWLERSPAARANVAALLESGDVVRVPFAGRTFYARRFPT